jgi:hypothetical protein
MAMIGMEWRSFVCMAGYAISAVSILLLSG